MVIFLDLLLEQISLTDGEAHYVLINLNLDKNVETFEFLLKTFLQHKYKIPRLKQSIQAARRKKTGHV